MNASQKYPSAISLVLLRVDTACLLAVPVDARPSIGLLTAIVLHHHHLSCDVYRTDFRIREA